MRASVITLALGAVLAAGVADARHFALRHTLADPTGAPGTRFGAAVAIAGTTVVVGAPNDGTNGSNAGAAYLFDAISGALLHTLTSPNAAPDDGFGTAVAIVGPNVAVGTPGDTDQDTGAVYVFDGGTGALLHSFFGPDPESGDEFGSALAVLGSDIVVGAPYGTGKVFVLDGSTGDVHQSFFPPNPMFSAFGAALAIVGSNVLIGAPYDSTPDPAAGAVYLFDEGSGALLQTFLNPVPTDPAPEFSLYGMPVASVGGQVIVGAPLQPSGTGVGTAYVFAPTGGTPLRTLDDPGGSDEFGSAVAAFGPDVLVGAPFNEQGANTAGAVYLFDGGTGAVVGTLVEPPPVGEDAFGSALATQGATILVGAPGADAAYLFDEVPYACGDGHLDTGEQCDDGNLQAGDGCAPDCTLEPPPAFKCYQARTHGTMQQAVQGMTIGAPESFCTPVGRDGLAASNPTANLTCYQLTSGQPPAGRVLGLHDALGSSTLTVTAPQTLCVPSERGGVASALNLSEFACYAARAKPGTPRSRSHRTLLADPFATRRATISRAVGLCSALDGEGHPFAAGGAYLTCYRLKKAGRLHTGVDIQNQLGSQSLRLGKAGMLCLPATAN